MRRSSGTRWRQARTMAVVGALLLAGCGSDGGEDGATDDPPVAETTVDPGSTEPADDGTGPDDSEPTDGTEPAEDTSAGDVDACAILDTLDVEGLLGEPPAERDDASSDAGAVCVVEPADPESRSTMRLVVETQRGPENFSQQKELLGVDSEPEGFGDEAFHTGPYLFVLDGDTLAFIQVLRDSTKGVGVEDAELEAAMTTVMEALGA